MKQDFVTYFAVLSFDVPGDAGITFPDFPGCTGQCKTDSNILAYASETLGFFLADWEEDLPAPTPPQNIHHEAFQALLPVRIYVPAYREALYSKSVTRTVTLPYWLDKAAKKENLNFSQTLQEALMQELAISR